jgi:hypothetical protein
VPAAEVERYIISPSLYRDPWPTDSFVRTGEVLVYEGPHALIKEGTVGGQIRAAFTATDCTFRDTITGVHAPRGDEGLLKALVAYVNSALASYYLFMTTGWGIDRKRVKKGEVLSLPAAPLRDEHTAAVLASLFETISTCTDDNQRKSLQAEIDSAIFKCFRVTKSEQALVRDMAMTGIDYAHNFFRSKSLKPPLRRHLEDYVEGFFSVFGRMLAAGKRGIAATIYGGASPLRVVSFKIADSQADWGKIIFKDQGDLDNVLRSLDRGLMQRESANLYRRRHARIFENQAVHIIKPAEARFWTRSAGFHDADETIAQTVAGRAYAPSRPESADAGSR